MGKASPGYDVHIVDDDGEEVEFETRGNIAIKSYVLDQGQKIRHPGAYFHTIINKIFDDWHDLIFAR